VYNDRAMGQETAFEYTVRTRQKTDETYTILVEQAPGHWIAQIRLPDGSFWTMNRFDPKSPAARILTNYFANEGMEVLRRRYLLEATS